MGVIQKLKDWKEWLNFEIEYTQIKVEKPNRDRIGKYLLFGGFIVAVLGMIGYILSPYKTEIYESITYKRYAPYSTIFGFLVLVGIISIIIAMAVWFGSDKYYDKTEV